MPDTILLKKSLAIIHSTIYGDLAVSVSHGDLGTTGIGFHPAALGFDLFDVGTTNRDYFKAAYGGPLTLNGPIDVVHWTHTPGSVAPISVTTPPWSRYLTLFTRL